MQLQGVDRYLLPANIPTTSDAPFAVGLSVRHRWDYANADRVCVMLQGGDCIAPEYTVPAAANFSQCAVRCWGHAAPSAPVPYEHGWRFQVGGVSPQGEVRTLAGDAVAGSAGHADGPAAAARFSNPRGVAVDHNGWVYVADTDNHAIRVIYGNGTVATLAGTPGRPGWRDGQAGSARFSSPIGIAVYCDAALNATLAAQGVSNPGRTGPHAGCLASVVIVADTYNHRIRRVALGRVTTLAGGANRAEEERELEAHGYADGVGCDARFNMPQGVTADDAGNVFVADSRNHVIRHIDPSGVVRTLAGRTQPLPFELPGCPPPCRMGVAGYEDGLLAQAGFTSPSGVALGPGRPYTLLVVDGNRVRLITRRGSSPFSDGAEPELGGPGHTTAASAEEIASLDMVQTIAGALSPGQEDWAGDAARFDTPRGVAFTPDGRVYVADASRCRIRRVTVTTSAAQAVGCSTRLVDILRPPGCTSHDFALDRRGLLHSAVQGAMALSFDRSVMNRTRDGQRVLQCAGVPPPDAGVQADARPAQPTGGTRDSPLLVDEDTQVGTHFMLRCPPACASLRYAVYGGSPASAGALYGDKSAVCGAAVHAGVIADGAGGVFTLTVAKGVGPAALAGRISGLSAATANGVTTVAAAKSPRTFFVALVTQPLNRTLVATVAGAPAAPLDSACGYEDAMPPHAARFHGPSALAAAPSSRSLTGSALLFVADARNNVIRSLSAACSQMCENGGNCTGPDTCTCAPGWGGFDCTAALCAACPPRTICTGPDSCTCVPGYSGAACDAAQCVQTCAHGGVCSAPDTCTCAAGWADMNCTTPVCAQTCGNGGNCTAPNTCACAAMWQGADCRTPVCEQGCVNGGTCTAPRTCTCPPEWSGHDCSKPVCWQGYFRPDPIPERFAPSPWRQPFWEQFTPCRYADWCASTDEFECQQHLRAAYPAILPGWRNVTGYRIPQSDCFVVELDPAARTPYRYQNEAGLVTAYHRFTPQFLYGWGPTATSHPWSAPGPASPDRHIAIVSYVNQSQGVYLCANGGDCTAPNTCVCADGWVGFDCRTPVCRQGFYYPDRVDPRYPGQGTYLVSERTLTVWEAPHTPNDKFAGYLHDHPNFHSILIDMDARLALPTTHQQTDGLGDDTKEGWRRNGWWVKLDLVEWQHGSFPLLFNRTCAASSKMRDLRSGAAFTPVDNPQEAFQARVRYDDVNVTATGRWNEAGGECVDQVQLGCFNKGTCVAPDTCKCAPGWEGFDCSLPVCWQSVVEEADDPDPGMPATLLRADGEYAGATSGAALAAGSRQVQYRHCPHLGNCTHPDTCTCEKGWTGVDCRTPLCAQECFHGGLCVAPDVCQCTTQPSAFKDRRDLALFAKPDGEAQETGWTGFDCNTPICTQAEMWVGNDDTGQYPVRLVSTENDGRTFEGGCPGVSRFYPATRMRISEELCGIASWYGGSFLEPWSNTFLQSYKSGGRRVRLNYPNYVRLANGTVLQGPETFGEGLYACYNKGSCTAPDTCECAAGWSGFDCNTPSCSSRDATGDLVLGCKNGGVCTAPDTCSCVTTDSLLPASYSDVTPGTRTGWMAPDCSMAICAQGYYDPECSGVPPGRGGVSSMGLGCYRCPNGGNCTGPDICACGPGWTGYDCRTPVCELRVSGALVAELNTLDLDKIVAFELDPCGHDRVADDGSGVYVRVGNCTRPNTCTCMCRRRSWRGGDGKLVEAPFVDPLTGTPPQGFVYGRFDCLDGYEGRLNADGTFASCHLKIYKPTWWDLNKVRVIVSIVVVAFVLAVAVGVSQLVLWRMNERKKKAQRRRRIRKEEAAAAAAAADSAPSAPPADEKDGDDDERPAASRRRPASTKQGKPDPPKRRPSAFATA